MRKLKGGKKYLLILFLIVLVGFFLRLLPAITRPIWDDDASSFFLAYYIPAKEIILGNYWDLTHPPFYFLLFHFWVKIRTTPLFLRLPSVLTGTSIIWLAFLIGEKLKDKKFGLICAWVAAISPYLIQFSWQIRPYVFAHFFVFLFLFLLLKYLIRPRWQIIILFFIINFLGIYNSYPYIWFVVAQGIFIAYLFLIRKERNLAFSLILPIGGSIIYFPRLLSVLKEGLGAISYYGTINIYKFINQILHLIGIGGFPEFYLRDYHPIVIVSLPLLLMAFLGVFHSWENTSKRQSFFRIFLTSLFISSCIIPALISFKQPVYQGRTIYAAFPFFLFGLGIFFYQINKIKKLLFLFFFILFILPSLFSIYLTAFHLIDWTERINWLEVSSVIQKDFEKNDAIFWFRASSLSKPFRYYFEDYNINIPKEKLYPLILLDDKGNLLEKTETYLNLYNGNCDFFQNKDCQRIALNQLKSTQNIWLIFLTWQENLDKEEKGIVNILDDTGWELERNVFYFDDGVKILRMHRV